MKIRRADLLDIPELHRLYGQLSESYNPVPGALVAALAYVPTAVFVIEEAGGLIGTATVSFFVVPTQGMVGHIDDVVVDDTCRGRGLGKLLVETCLEEARKRRARLVELTSHPRRRAANGLYKKLGFTRRRTNVYHLALVTE